MTGDDFRRRADAVRWIPLEIVLAHWGGRRDPHDKHRWHTELGPLSITGAKFFNWHLHQGGGGAIDLVIHLGDMDVSAAVSWLEQYLGSPDAASSSLATFPRPSSSSHGDSQNLSVAIRLPRPSIDQLDRVRRYLTDQRSLAPGVLQPLIDTGKVYADHHGNAVFLMVAGKANRPIGAELRGTGSRAWRGLAPGSSKDAGYFWVGAKGSRDIVLCESAIDAISCFQWHWAQLHTTCICISTAGARSNPPWLTPLLARGYHIHCGFDNDDTGNAASHRMIALHPSIKRLPPPAHDWNDALTLRS